MQPAQQRLCARLSALSLSASTRPGQAPIHATRTAIRCLSSTPSTLYQQVRVPRSDIPIPASNPHRNMPEVPDYPYGPRQVYKQSNSGLYGSSRIRFGNKVSERNEVKTRRKWRPNVHSRRLWSEALGVKVRTRVTTRVLRTIDKVGGLDAYLLGGKSQRLKDLGPWGWRLRWRLMQTPSVKERFAREREALGLAAKSHEEIVRAEMDAVLPKGVTPEQAAAETQALLDGEAEFKLEPEQELKESFMKEVSKDELAQQKGQAEQVFAKKEKPAKQAPARESEPQPTKLDSKRGPEQFMKR